MKFARNSNKFKSQLFLLLLLSFPLILMSFQLKANAQNRFLDKDIDLDQINPSILLQMKTFGGYTTAEAAGYEEGLTISLDGMIHSYRRINGHSPEIKVVLGKLSAEMIAKIQQRSEIITPAVLELEDPNSLSCSDTPQTDYLIHKKDSSFVIFATKASCQKFILKGQYEIYPLMNLLDGLSSL